MKSSKFKSGGRELGGGLRIAVTIAAAAMLVGGCAREPSHWRAAVTSADLFAASEHGGLAPGEGRIELRVASEAVAFDYAGEELVVVTAPGDWPMRVVQVAASELHERAYHWATVIWERGDGTPARVTVKYHGEHALFLEVDGKEQRIAPGVHLSLE